MSAGAAFYVFRCLDRDGGLVYVDYTDDPTAIGQEVARYRWGRRVSNWTLDSRVFVTERAAGRAVREVVAAEEPEYAAMTVPWKWKVAAAAVVWLALFAGVWWAVAGRVDRGDGAFLGVVVATAVVGGVGFQAVRR